MDEDINEDINKGKTNLYKNVDMTNSDRFTYVHSRYNKEFEIKENIEQKAGILLTAVGLYLSVLLINIFSNNITTFTKQGIVTTMEFTHTFAFDINIICSIVISFSIYRHIINKTTKINIYIIGTLFSFFVIYSPILLMVLYFFKKHTSTFFDFNIKTILFFSIVILLIQAVFKLIKCISNSKYHLMNFYNNEKDVESIFKMNYVDIIGLLIEYTENNIKINEIKAKYYNESVQLFYITIIFTLLYLI